MSTTVYLLLGSNRGDRLHYLREAVCRMAVEAVHLQAVSSVYSSAPWGDACYGSDFFLNQAVKATTRLSPSLLLASLLAIERCMGRDDRFRVAPRPIDIDILLYGDRVISEAGLKVPHPLMAMRRFVLVPLAEIAADVCHPQLDKSIDKLLQACNDPLPVAVYQPM